MIVSKQNDQVQSSSELIVKAMILIMSCFNLFGLFLLLSNQQSSSNSARIERSATN